MVVRSLDIEKDPFRPREEKEEILGPHVPYLSAIGALMYLANSTRPDIAFAVNLLARHSAAPTKRHWVGVKTVLRYLNGTRDLGLFYNRNQDSSLLGYTDAGYLSDPHNGISQTGFVFLQGGTAISWKSTKQTLLSTSTNHFEIIDLYEASRESIWLRRMINHIIQSSLKIILHVLLRWNQVILRVIRLNILFPNYSIPMNSKRMEKLKSCRLSHVIIWQIYSQNLYHTLHFINALKVLV